MNIQEILQKFEILEMSMYENPRKDFVEFRQYVLDNPKAKKTYYLFNDLKIPSDTIIHVQKRHKLTNTDWNKCLQAYQNGFLLNQNISNKTRYNGKACKYLYQYDNNYIGIVIEILKK